MLLDSREEALHSRAEVRHILEADMLLAPARHTRLDSREEERRIRVADRLLALPELPDSHIAVVAVVAPMPEHHHRRPDILEADRRQELARRTLPDRHHRREADRHHRRAADRCQELARRTLPEEDSLLDSRTAEARLLALRSLEVERTLLPPPPLLLLLPPPWSKEAPTKPASRR